MRSRSWDIEFRLLFALSKSGADSAGCHVSDRVVRSCGEKERAGHALLVEKEDSAKHTRYGGRDYRPDQTDPEKVSSSHSSQTGYTECATSGFPLAHFRYR
jgi:hypothetical protein